MLCSALHHGIARRVARTVSTGCNQLGCIASRNLIIQVRPRVPSTTLTNALEVAGLTGDSDISAGGQAGKELSADLTSGDIDNPNKSEDLVENPSHFKRRGKAAQTNDTGGECEPVRRSESRNRSISRKKRRRRRDTDAVEELLELSGRKSGFMSETWKDEWGEDSMSSRVSVAQCILNEVTQSLFRKNSSQKRTPGVVVSLRKCLGTTIE